MGYIKKFLFYFIWKIAYRLACILPVNKKLIIFAYNQNYTQMPDNMIPLYNQLKSKGYKCKIINSPVKVINRMIYETFFQFTYARARCVFVTDYFFPIYANKPRKDTKVIQLWHACGAFKKWGYSTIDLAWGGTRQQIMEFPMHNTYTDVAVSAESVIPCYAEAFGCDEKIIKPLGTPRTDIYFDEKFINSQREEILKLFPAIGDRKIILYAPTFRGNKVSESYNEIRLDFDKMYKELSDEYVLVLKLHPFTAKKFNLNADDKAKYGDFIFNGSTSLKIETALCGADILISDYSSLIFEYALLNKPMMFYSYDLEEYDRDRSFYFDYKSFVPGKIVLGTDEIITAVKDKDFEFEKVEEFKNKFMSACDGNSTRRIIEKALGD